MRPRTSLLFCSAPPARDPPRQESDLPPPFPSFFVIFPSPSPDAIDRSARSSPAGRAADRGSTRFLCRRPNQRVGSRPPRGLLRRGRRPLPPAVQAKGRGGDQGEDAESRRPSPLAGGPTQLTKHPCLSPPKTSRREAERGFGAPRRARHAAADERHPVRELRALRQDPCGAWGPRPAQLCFLREEPKARGGEGWTDGRRRRDQVPRPLRLRWDRRACHRDPAHRQASPLELSGERERERGWRSRSLLSDGGFGNSTISPPLLQRPDAFPLGSPPGFPSWVPFCYFFYHPFLFALAAWLQDLKDGRGDDDDNGGGGKRAPEAISAGS